MALPSFGIFGQVTTIERIQMLTEAQWSRVNLPVGIEAVIKAAVLLGALFVDLTWIWTNT